MTAIQENIFLIESLLMVELPASYKKYLEDVETENLKKGTLLGLPLSLELSSVWGATEFLRSFRPDIEPSYVPVKIVGSLALCLSLGSGEIDDAPLMEIDLEGTTPPVPICASLSDYLENPTREDLWPARSDIASSDDPWFQHGRERLDWHMRPENRSYQYDHKEGGKIPRTHQWRPHRFCVQDVIMGITVIRQDRKYNRLEVDVFLTASIPEYEADSGCRALTLILLSDAYKSGGSMEIKFTNHVEGGRIPHELCDLASKLGITLNHVREGGITPKEAKTLYLALSGLSEKVRGKVLSLEEEGRLSAASVSYALHHGVWTVQELEIILFSSRHPDSILKGSCPEEVWHLFYDDLFHGRNALLGGYLDRQLFWKEHKVEEKEGSIVEMEDDERNLEILYHPDYGAKEYRLPEMESEVPIPWLINEFYPGVFSPGHPLWVLLRVRTMDNLQDRLDEDLSQAIQLKKMTPGLVCIMVPGDFKRMDSTAIIEKANRQQIGLIVCPEFLNQLDQEVTRRFEAIKVMRQ